MAKHKNRMRDLRAELQVSGEQAARKAGISLSAWRKIEYGERHPMLWTARRIAAALECTVDDVFPPEEGNSDGRSNG